MVGPVIQVPLHSRFEAAFESALAYENPVQDVRVTVQFTGPSGEFNIDAFWDGAACWRVRFSPEHTGRWSWRTDCSRPDDSGLHGKEGKFDCCQTASRNEWIANGPLQVSADRRYLEYANGAPFFWLADTAWNGPLKSSEIGWDLYLADRRRKGFSVIQFVATQWLGAPADAEGRPAYTNQKKIGIEPEFFQRMDRRIDRINDFGLVAAPVLAWAATWNQGSAHLNPGTSLPDDQLIVLIRYLVSRYGAHQAVWILAGDGIYQGAEAERWRRIGRAALAGSRRLATMHPSARLRVNREFEGESWYSFNGYQSGQFNDAESSRWINWLNAERPKDLRQPTIDLEPCYEDHRPLNAQDGRIDARDVRRACYWSLLASPVAGVSYGAHGVWSWENFPAIPLSHPKSGEARPWAEAMKLPGSESMSHLRTILCSIDWWRLNPCSQMLAAQPGIDDPLRFVAAACSPERDLALIYAPEGGRIQIRADCLPRGLAVCCFDPANGIELWSQPLEQGAASIDCGDDADRLLLIKPKEGRTGR
jgi:hypothetical protein